MRTHDPIKVDDDASTITIPHWGITMRRIFGAALAGWGKHEPGRVRNFKVFVNDGQIATIRVRQFRDEP